MVGKESSNKRSKVKENKAWQDPAKSVHQQGGTFNLDTSCIIIVIIYLAIGLMHDDVPAVKNHHQVSFVRHSLQTFDKFTLFLSGYSFQLCSFENTWIKLLQVYN